MIKYDDEFIQEADINNDGVTSPAVHKSDNVSREAVYHVSRCWVSENSGRHHDDLPTLILKFSNPHGVTSSRC